MIIVPLLKTRHLTIQHSHLDFFSIEKFPNLFYAKIHYCQESPAIRDFQVCYQLKTFDLSYYDESIESLNLLLALKELSLIRFGNRLVIM